jgi:hypothetical protein
MWLLISKWDFVIYYFGFFKREKTLHVHVGFGHKILVWIWKKILNKISRHMSWGYSTLVTILQQAFQWQIVNNFPSFLPYLLIEQLKVIKKYEAWALGTLSALLILHNENGIILMSIYTFKHYVPSKLSINKGILR